MRVAIVAPSPIPFGPGGAEGVWSGLYAHLLGETSHDVELIKVPVRETTLPEVMAAYETLSRLDLSHFDLVITGKYPAWMVRHPQHVLYMLHPLRGLYDSYGLFHRPLSETSRDPFVRRLVSAAAHLRPESLPDLFARWSEARGHLDPDHRVLTFPGPLARTLVHALDAMALGPAQIVRHHAISWTVASRAGYFPAGVGVRVVHPPSDLPGLHEEKGEYFFTASRHDAPKRLDLLVEAMRYYPGGRHLLIAGSGPQTEYLKALADGDPRIEFVGRVSPAELVGHYARAIGVPFVPFDEDLGLITYEAMASGKPVLTARDSGGPTELVRHGVNGLIVEPTPQALGAGLARLEAMGADPVVASEARGAVRRQSWARVAHELLGIRARSRPSRPRASRPRLAITSTFPVWPPRGGGQLRAFHLYGALADVFDIDIVCQASSSTAPSRRMIRPGVTEHVVPRSREHDLRVNEIAAVAGIPVTDIVAARLSALTPQYAAALREVTSDAVGVILADPFLFPVAEEVAERLPVIYDAYNCEYVLKAQMLPSGPLAKELLAEVREVEGRAVRASRLVLTVSDEDRLQLTELYGARDELFVSAPNGTDLASVHYTASGLRRRNSDRWLTRLARAGGASDLSRLALFVGSWHEPNNQAARRIVALARELPDVGFLMVGSHTGTLRQAAVPANVFLLGVVPDVVKTSLLATADVALAPLSSGSGTNLKVVEYLAAGVPVVSTEVGIRGLRLHAPVAEIAEIAGIEDFVPTIRRLLCDPSAAARSARGAAAIRRSYDWGVIGRGITPKIATALGLTV